jgi:inner membrane protein
VDSITQATLGAAVGEAVLGKRLGNKAAVTGAVVATIPDLDVLLTPFFNEVQKISIHRGFSHSIVFCLLLSLLLASIFKKNKAFKPVPYHRLWLFNFLALFTHILLDAFTTYGTQLFLPFNNWRVSLDSINIIDPVYTIPLLAGVLISTYFFDRSHNLRSLPNSIGIVISSLYLVFTLGNKQHVENVFNKALQSQGILKNELLTVPVKIGNMNWYGVAKTNDKIYLGQYNELGNQQKISFDSFPINDHLLDGMDPYLAEKMRWFAKGFYTVAKNDDQIRIYNMQCDMQGIRKYGDYKAPTAFYFEITPLGNNQYELSTGMHKEEKD